jgi:hypothetical protein
MLQTDAAHLYVEAIGRLKKHDISTHSPLEEIVIRTCGNDLAYVDNRKEAKERYGFDLWRGLSADWLRAHEIEKSILYSESQAFPDFLFKTKMHEGKYSNGSLMELKDSKGDAISSFNSTIPTKTKTLEEIDVVNGGNLVSRIASIIDGRQTSDRQYSVFERRCFYLIRTHKESERVKLSIVDGSFFETIPKERLFYQMFLNVLRKHLNKEKVEVPAETMKRVEETLSHINDQTLIAASQTIEKASVKPRLRIMAEVHPEGNPHSTHYPEITEGSFNLILQSSPETREIEKGLLTLLPEVDAFSIHHKRNGEHRVLQFRSERGLRKFLSRK